MSGFMWNRGRTIWFRLRTKKGRSLTLPLSPYVIRELLDSVLDLLTVASAVVPEKARDGSRVSVHTAKELLGMLTELLGCLGGDGPYDLLDVEADGTAVSIKIR